MLLRTRSLPFVMAFSFVTVPCRETLVFGNMEESCEGDEMGRGGVSLRTMANVEMPRRATIRARYFIVLWGERFKLIFLLRGEWQKE